MLALTSRPTRAAPTKIDAIRSDREHVRRFGLTEFMRRGWHALYPSKTYRERWYHRALCDELERLHRREFNSLAVTMPPSTQKSTIASVFYPARRWIDYPHEGIVSATYDSRLGAGWSRGVRTLVSSSWFRDRWGGRVRVDVDANGKRLAAGVLEFPNNRGGFLFSTTCPRGALTGRHPGLRKVDDPIKPIAATTDNLATINDWFGNTFASRADDPRTVQSLVVQQRLAKNDLADLVVQSYGYRLFSLPAEFDPENAHPADPRTKAGESIDEEHLSAEVLAKLRIMLASAFAAQYNQAPGVGGRIFERDHFKFYDELPSNFDYAVVSLDCSFKDTAASDYVAGQVWGVKGPDFFLIDQFHDQLGFVDTLAALGDLLARNPWVHDKLIEDKANGSAVIDVVKRKFPGVTEVNPLGGKITRANAIAPVVRSGNVWLPRGAAWVQVFLDEVADFPNRRRDDQVDAMSQALAHLLNLGFGEPSSIYQNLDFLGQLYSYR